MPREKANGRLRVVRAICTEKVLRGLVVDIPVGFIELPDEGT